MNRDIINKVASYRPPGPVAAAFMRDRSTFIRFLLGPVGGGKTVSCIFDHLHNAALAPPCIDNKIRYRAAIIGETYGQIERNLYPSWFEWIPQDGGEWTEGEFKGGGGRFAKQKIQFAVPRGGSELPVDCEFIFAAIGDMKAEQFMRGFEPTAIHLYEADLLAEDVLDQAIPRVGRYPSGRLRRAGEEYRSHIIGELNAPDIDSWIYRRFEEERPDNHKLYKQPSGRSARAENVHNLPPGYYDRQVATMAKKRHGSITIKRYVDAQYAPTLAGEPVYPEYSDDLHLSPDEFGLVPNVPIRIGLDAGQRRPAAVIGQWMPNSQWRIWKEFVPGRMGPRDFGAKLKKFLAMHGADKWEIAAVYSDPFGETGRTEGQENVDHATESWTDGVASQLGVVIWPTETNEIDLRLSAVSEELTTMIDGRTPALWLNRDCKMLRKGFVSHYRYDIVKNSVGERSDAVPVKGIYSDPHDALQYLILGSKGIEGVTHADRRTTGDMERRSEGRGRRRWRGESEGSQVIQSDYIDADAW